MKKIFACLAMLAAVCCFGLTACKKGADKDKGGAISVAAMNGPTMIGLGQLNDRIKSGDAAVADFTIEKVVSADSVASGFVNRMYDAAALPCNVASKLFNNKDLDVQVAAINTLNVLNIVENGNTIQAFSDLAGKTIVLPEQGSTPEYVLRYLLDKHNINATLEFKTSAEELSIAFKGGLVSIALLPQPAATAVTTGNTHGGRITDIDFDAEWQRIPGNENTGVVTGVFVVRNDYLVNNRDTFNKFLTEYKLSVEYMTDTNNLDAAAQFAVDMGIIGALPVAKKALPSCGMSFIEGADMKTKVNAYLQILHGQNPDSIGGKIPTDAFYYSR